MRNGFPLWFRAFFGIVALCSGLMLLLYMAKAARDCAEKDGVFIATQYNWPICLDKEVLR